MFTQYLVGEGQLHALEGKGEHGRPRFDVVSPLTVTFPSFCFCLSERHWTFKLVQ